MVPIDFSQVSLNALDFAATIAHKTSAEILLLHVVESYEYNTGLKEVINPDNAVEKEIQKKLDDLRTENTNLWGIRIKTLLTKGKIHRQIQKAQKDQNIDLIIMGTTGASGTSGFGRYFLGSNAHRTVNISECPVITMRKGNHSKEIKHIVVPFDLQKETTQKVSFAIKLAKTFGSTIHVISVTGFFDEFKHSIDTVKLRLDEIAGQISKEGIKVTTKMLRQKDIAETVMEYAKVVNADLTIIMTRAEKKFNEIFLGSNARTIVTTSELPVMSLHPKKVG